MTLHGNVAFVLALLVHLVSWSNHPTYCQIASSIHRSNTCVVRCLAEPAYQVITGSAKCCADSSARLLQGGAAAQT